MSRFSARRGRRPRVFVLAALVTLGACTDESPATAPRADVARALAPDPLAGDVITVTNASGGKDAGSLRWAVAQATGGEVIRFAPALAGATITLDSTLLVNAHATIEGPADRGITISAGGKGRVILVGSGATQPVTLRNLTITGGKVPDEPGAGITVVSSVILEHVTVTGNEAKHAAAIYQWGGLPSSVVIVNSTVSGNVTTGVWPATIQADGDITLINSTVANNTGGVSTFNSGLKTLWNSIVANNGGTNCSSTVGLVYIGRNLSDDAGCGEASVMLIGDPKLEALAANGGPTMTHALHPSSPALNAATSCSVDVDQRYVARDARCDIGAVEGAAATAVVITIDAGATVDVASGAARISGTVRCSRDGDQFGVRVQVQQQKTDNAPTVVRGAGEASVACTTTAQPWSAVVVPASGAFRAGAAAATAATYQAASWVTPATAARSLTLLRPRS